MERLQGDPKRIVHFIRTKTLRTLYSETTYLLSLKLRLQRVLMSTPICQTSTPDRLVVSEYEVPKVFVRIKCTIIFGSPCIIVLFDHNGPISEFGPTNRTQCEHCARL